MILTAAWWLWSQFAPISRGPGVLVREGPEQIDLVTAQPVVDLHGWKLKPLALYKLKARVLAKARYNDDATAELAPYDLAVGWGPMSDSAVLDRLEIRQFFRFYQWRYRSDPQPAPAKEIIRHSANVHIIPESESVLGQIRRLRPGSLVDLRGTLVEATKPGMSLPWRSSLTRNDGGDGACEIMLVRVVLELD